MKVTVIGLGKLGLPLVATIASKGHQAIGVDVRKKVIDDLNIGRSDLKEPGLLKMIKKFKKNIKATVDTKKAVKESDLTFIVMPTPSLKNGYFSLKYVVAVARDIAKVLKTKKSFHLVVLISTVMPGATEKVRVILEKVSGKVCSKDFGLCYNPEFIALGTVIYNLLNPDFILMGESDKKAGDILQSFYKKYCDNKPKIARMNFVNAELTKISVNTFVTTKISYANMLAEICEKLSGGNVDIVTSALGLDSRIGEKYLKGGPSFGGPCFPRDNIAFISFAKKMKSAYSIPVATHKTNIRQIKRLVEKVLEFTSPKDSVGILGLSYKPDTDVIEESAGLFLTKMLIDKKIKINLHDPVALENTQKLLGSSVNYMKNIKSCIENSQILVITTNWPQYKNINKMWFSIKLKVIIDPWRMIEANSLSKHIKYVSFGLGINKEQS